MRRLACALALSAGLSAPATVLGAQTLTFEGFAQGTFFAENQFEASHGVRFFAGSNEAFATVSAERVCDGDSMWANAPSGCGALAFATGSANGFDVPAGFTDMFSLHYLSPNGGGWFVVMDGFGGSGNVLASASLTSTGASPCQGGLFCSWREVGVTFSGTAKSVRFWSAYSLSTGEAVFDDITFGRASQTTVPEPSTGVLMLSGIALLGGWACRRRRRPDTP